MSAKVAAEEAGISWKLSALTDKASAEAALAASVEDGWDDELVLSAHEADPENQDSWRFEAWYPRRPTRVLREKLEALFDEKAPDFFAEKVAPTDWITLSQQGMAPVRAGPFHIRTPDHQPDPQLVCIGAKGQLDSGGIAALLQTA